MIRRLRVLGAGLLILASADLSATISTFNTASRSAVATAYTNTYLVNRAVPSGWSGNVAGCNAGTTTDAYQQATIDTANFYRVMVGLPQVNLITDPAIVNRAQQAALILAANGTTLAGPSDPDVHHPNAGDICWSQAGAEGSGASNLAWGFNSPNNGPYAIDGYINDKGNETTLGHRRWLLFSSQIGFATADVISPPVSTNALRVFAAPQISVDAVTKDVTTINGSTVPDESASSFTGTSPPSAWTAWPSPGFVPSPLIPSSGYWSIAYPGANFSSATVTMTTANGAAVPMAPAPALPSAALPNNYGDNTFRFEPSGLSFAPGMADTSYKIVVSNVTGGGPASYCYTVTIFDPATSASDAAPDLCASTHTLTVTVTGNGSVDDGPLTIITACTTAGGAACSGTYATGTTVTLTATEGAGYTFSKWSGDCSGTTSTTQVTMIAPYSCTAEFAPLTPAPGSAQTITFDAQTPVSQTFIAGGTFSLNPAASASSGLAIVYSSTTSGVCTVDASTGDVTMVTTGTCTIAADQPGDATYVAAAEVTQSVQITSAGGATAQTITFDAQIPASQTFAVGGTFPLNPAASTSSGLAIVYSSTTSGVCTVDASTGDVTMVALGTCTIAADQPGDATYAAAVQVTQSVQITSAGGATAQTITFGVQARTNQTFIAGGTFSLSPAASASSGLAIVYSSTTSGVCTVDASTGDVTMVTTGTCTIAADQPGDATYAAAAEVTQSVQIVSAGGTTAQTITFDAQTPASQTFAAGGTFSLSPAASASSGLAIVYSSTTSGVCTVNASTGLVMMVTTGTCTIAADQPGDATYAAAAEVTQSVQIISAGGTTAQTITFDAQTPASQTFAAGGTFPLSPAASASSGLAIVYSSTTSGVCTVNASTGDVTMVTTGTCTIAADQPGDATYAAAAEVTQSVQIISAGGTT
ncbi:MAG: hypothetical protein LBQ20_03015, partial [Rhodanobacter sp.]|nr:hypothetical protein [Rhodanobacter sp.]